jgi:dihydroflavonol-4-reductase
VEFQSAAVTGATGHLGNAVVRDLLARGKRVRALVQAGDDARALSGLDVERVEGDVLRPETLDAAFAGVDVVFHLAGVVSISPLDIEVVRTVNEDGTRHVLDAVRRAGTRRLVYTSSVHALTDPAPGGVLTEEAGYDPARQESAYGRAKCRATLAVLEAARQGLDAVVVNPVYVIGPHDYRLSEIGELLLLLHRFPIPAGTAGCYDFIDVRDVARGHVLAAERGRTGESYLLSGSRMTVREMMTLLSRLAGRTPPRFFLPLGVAGVLARSAPLVERITRRRALLTPVAVKTLGVDFAISDAKARRELGHTSRPVAESLRDAWEWMAAHPDSPRNRPIPPRRPGRA